MAACMSSWCAAGGCQAQGTALCGGCSNGATAACSASGSFPSDIIGSADQSLSDSHDSG